jgi:excisionase family DNA binding protein
MNSALHRDVLTVEQAADLLQSCLHMVYSLIRRADLKAGRIGGKYWRIARI